MLMPFTWLTDDLLKDNPSSKLRLSISAAQSWLFCEKYENARNLGIVRACADKSLLCSPVKKFGRVRLSTIFLQNKYGGECRHGGTMSFCSVLSFPASKHQEKISRLFLWNLWTSGGVMYERFMGDYTYRHWFGISASSVIYTRHDLRTGFQRKLSCKPLTGLTRLTD